jgi:hypothetical protein
MSIMRVACQVAFFALSITHPFVLSAQKPWRPVDSVQVVYTEASTSDSVPIGEVVGVVLDAYKASPLQYANVFAYDAATKRSFHAITTAEGRFRLRGLKAGAWMLHAELFGHAKDSVAINSNAGTVARFGLSGVHIELCADEIGPQPAIVVIVRDVRTGRAPNVPVTLRVRNDSASYSTTKAASTAPEDSIFWVGAGSRWSRTYSVELTAKGYATWRIREVELQKRGCGGYFERTLAAWILPN